MTVDCLDVHMLVKRLNFDLRSRGYARQQLRDWLNKRAYSTSFNILAQTTGRLLVGGQLGHRVLRSAFFQYLAENEIVRRHSAKIVAG